jgi:hypothetical protein
MLPFTLWPTNSSFHDVSSPVLVLYVCCDLRAKLRFVIKWEMGYVWVIAADFIL